MWTGQTKQKGDVKTTVTDAVEKKDVAGGSSVLTLSLSRPNSTGSRIDSEFPSNSQARS